MKTIKTIGALLLAVLLLASLGVSAFASGAYPAKTGPAASTFTQTIDVGADANCPAAQYTYSCVGVAPAAGSPDFYYEGTGTVSVTPAPLAFTAGEAKDTNNKVIKTVTMNFSGCSFTEPGVYCYELTATQPTVTGLQHDNPTRKVFVSVEDNGDGTLKNPVVTIMEADGTTKSTGYVSTVGSAQLTLKKSVSGSQGSRDKYFKFTVTLGNLGANTVISLDMTHAQKTPPATSSTKAEYTAAVMAAANNRDSLTAGSDGSVTQVFYLSHGDYIIFKGLPKGATYSISEDAESYTQSLASGSAALTSSDFQNSAEVNVVNTKNGTVPTGVMLTVIPGVVIVAVAAAGLVMLSRKKKKDD